jgi:hypothetical protein
VGAWQSKIKKAGARTQYQ